mmetsp:Transcript_50304/g.106915  ORF Transcript_50304/g.106915 Transcript_50304/m.106915 type:complete len:237 (-) Transcript_50304:47-757(-)
MAEDASGTTPKRRWGKKQQRKEADLAEATADIGEAGMQTGTAAELMEEVATAAAEEMAEELSKQDQGGARGRKLSKGKRKKLREASARAEQKEKETALQIDGLAESTNAVASGLSTNVSGLKFMQSAKEEELKKQQEKMQLRHLDAMRWVIPGFEVEVEAAEAKPPASGSALAEKSAEGPPPPLRLARRSYKGFNPVVQQWVKEKRGAHVLATRKAEEFEEASTLTRMKKQRVKTK